MNRNIFVLVTVASLASVLNMARAETMEERKQRIMRKYMRERQSIMQSDFGVPEAVQEDARVVESEQFKEISPDFQRQKGGVAPPPMARSVPVQQDERNWWLETADMEEDPFADSFSSQTDSDERSADSRSPWGRREDSSTYGGGYGQQRDRQDDSYSGSREDSSIYGDDSSLQWGGRGSAYPDRSSVYGSQRKYGDQSSLPDMTYDGFTTGRAPTSRENNQMPGYYGRQQMNTRGAGTGWELDSGRRYDALPSTGWPQSTLPTPTDRQGWSSQDQTPGYTPYRNPYQTEDDGQRRYGDNFQPQQTEYSRPNNYQKWKDRNESWNPSSGNAYLDELMRDDRR